jgi:hypothetical protein
MDNIRVGDLVVLNSDRSVIGEVLPTSATENGLHSAYERDLWDIGDGRPRFTDNGKVPVLWNAGHGSYEWWEDPEFLICCAVRHR